MTQKRALITGITGQDGSYLAELLLEEGYLVYGLVRRVAGPPQPQRMWRIAHLLDSPSLQLLPGSLDEPASVLTAVAEAQPDECYHLAAQSDVGWSFRDEFSTMAINVTGTHHILWAIKRLAANSRIYFAATSEMFGDADCEVQNEDTAFNPRSTYAISKVAGFHMARHYRERHGMHVSSGILFNHESERRGLEFVSRRVTSQVAAIKAGKASEIRLGNLDAKRDWGYAPDYVRAMWLMLQQEQPDDYVIATGETRTVGELAQAACQIAGIKLRKHLVLDPALHRPTEVSVLCGSARKAQQKLGWKPKVPFRAMLQKMLAADELAQTSQSQ